MHRRALLVLAVLAAASSGVHASGYISRGHDGYDRGGAGYFEPVYDDDGVRYAQGEVLDVQPIYRSVRHATPERVCYDQPVRHYEAGRPQSPGGTVLGALIGGVIGNQIARGHGHRGYHHRRHHRDTATLAGAAIGASIGYQASRGPGYVTEGYQQRCHVEERWQHGEEVVGYDVTYRYRGEVFQTRTDHHPGESIPVRVSVHALH